MQRIKTPEETLIDNLNDDSLRSTDQSLAVLIRTKEIGAETLKELHAQGQQLENAQAGVDNVLYQQEVGERHARSIASFFWDIINWFRARPVMPDHVGEVNQEIAAANAAKAKAAAKKSSHSSVQTKLAEGRSKRIIAPEDKEEQSNRKLDEMSDHLKDLTAMATQMGDEISHHNRRLEVLDKTTETANIKLGSLNRTLQKI